MGSPLRFIGLITDYGYGYYVGVLESVIKSINESAGVINVDHEVPGFDVIAGAYVVRVSYYWLPKGSIIVAVVDPGVGGARRALAVEAGDYVFIGPDNGLLYPAIVVEGFKRGVELSPGKISKLVESKFKGKIGGAWALSATFHGRDLFGPAAALLTLGYDLEDLGSPISFNDIEKLELEYVEFEGSSYRVKVVYIDRFGNTVLSCRPQQIEFNLEGEYEVNVGNRAFKVSPAVKFSDVREGELLLYVNSFNFMELAINRGSASQKLGLRVGDIITVKRLNMLRRHF